MHWKPVNLPGRASRSGVVFLALTFALAGCERGAEDGASMEAPAVPVVTQIVERETISDRVEAVGTTRANDSVEITARVSNVVTGIGFEEGEFVEKGEVLARLESSEARANLAEAEANLAEIRTQYERTLELIDSHAVSRSVLDQQAAQMKSAEARVNAARAALADHTIRAPFAGRVGLRRVSVGTLVTPGVVITTLDQISQMELDFSVPESYLSTIEPGQSVQARSVAFPDEVFVGKVDSIDTRIDPVTRTVNVRARLANEEGRLRPGMFMTVVLEKNQREALVVPELAIVPEGEHQYVFVVQDDTVVQRKVAIGARIPGFVEITAGLEPGEEIVVEGTQSLRHGSTIRRVESPTRDAS